MDNTVATRSNDGLGERRKATGVGVLGGWGWHLGTVPGLEPPELCEGAPGPL